MKNTFLKEVIKYSFSILVLAVILFLTRNQWASYSEIVNLPISSFVYLSLLFFAMQLLVSKNLKLLLNIFKVNLTMLECFRLISLQAFYNYLPLNAGTIYNAAYLKKNKDFPISKFVSIASLNIVIMAFTFGLCGSFALLYNLIQTREIDTTLILYSSLFIVGGVGFFLVNLLPKINRDNRIFNWINGVKEGWKIMSQEPLVLFKVIICDVLILLVLAIRFMIIFEFLKSEISFVAIIFITIMTTLIRFNSIFPGNLGLRESIVGGMSKSFGIDFNIGFIAGIIDRIVAIIWIFLFGIFYHFSSLKK